MLLLLLFFFICGIWFCYKSFNKFLITSGFLLLYRYLCVLVSFANWYYSFTFLIAKSRRNLDTKFHSTLTARQISEAPTTLCHPPWGHGCAWQVWALQVRQCGRNVTDIWTSILWLSSFESIAPQVVLVNTERSGDHQDTLSCNEECNDVPYLYLNELEFDWWTS